MESKKVLFTAWFAQTLAKFGLESVSVSLKGIVSFNHEGKRHVGVSDELIEKIMDFDNEKKMEPFIFRVEYVKAFDTEDSEWEGEYFDFKTDLSDKRHALYEALRK